MEMTVNDTPFAERIESLRREYYRYLYNLMRGNNHNGHSYNFLFTILFRVDFVAAVERDENRIEDAKEMRKAWLIERNETDPDKIPLDALDGPASLLEVMVALAIRIEDDIMQNDNEGDRTTNWFWAMLQNAGLERCTDDDPSEDAESYIYSVVNRVMDREYGVDGRGGFWPVVLSKADQRKVELWYQASAWLCENYGGTEI